MQNTPGRAAASALPESLQGSYTGNGLEVFVLPGVFSFREWAQKSLAKECTRGIAGLACLLLVLGEGEGWVAFLSYVLLWACF